MCINEYMTDLFKIQLFLEGLTAVAKAGPHPNGKIWFIRNRDVLKSKRVSLRTLLILSGCNDKLGKEIITRQ